MAADPRLVIFSRSYLSRDEIARELDSLKQDILGLSIETMDLSLLSTFQKTAQSVVIDLEHFIPSDELSLVELRGVGYNGPVVVLSSRVDEKQSESYASQNVVFYDRAAGMADFAGIVRRSILGSVLARRHPRHRTDEVAVINIDGIPIEFQCRVRNLSKGGAMLEADRALNIRPGTKMVVKIILKSVGKTRTVQARVAWVSQLLFGVEFL